MENSKHNRDVKMLKRRQDGNVEHHIDVKMLKRRQDGKC
jgi:hypothetical protein